MTPKRTSTAIKKPVSLRDEAKAMFRDAILQTAERVFDDVGYHSARIQDIAEKARIGVGTVYNHFAQKEDMLRSLIDERLNELERELHVRPEDPRDWVSKTRLRFRRMGAFVEQHRHFFRIMCDVGLFGACSSDSLRILGPRGAERHAKKLAESQALVEEGIAAGVLAPGDSRRLARFLGGAMRGVLEDALKSGHQDLQTEIDLVLEMFLRACAPVPGKTKGAR